MNLGDIQALVAVVETGSLAHAAVKLHLTQPAITRRIQRLEETLAVKLLDRDVKPARLTAEGRVAYAECIHVLNAAESLKGAVGADFDSERTLRIGISVGVADLVLPLLLPSPPEWEPVCFEVAPSPFLERSVAERNFDAALVFREVGREPRAGERLARLSVSVVAARKLGLPARVALNDLRGQRWVLCPDGCGYRRALEHGLYGAAQALDVAASLWGFEQQAGLVASGVGLGLIPDRILAQSRHGTDLAIVKVSDFSAALDLWAVRPDVAMAPKPRFAPIRNALLTALAEPLAKVS